MRRLLLIVLLCPLAAFAANSKPCVSVDEAAKVRDNDVCIEAHVYDVVELPDGTRFLDVCAPGTPDEQCRFTIVSLPGDREQVGELRSYRDANVHVRGMVQQMNGRSGMLLSHARQFRGGPPKFRPNPMLLHGFTGQQGKPPILAPNLGHGGHRKFMSAHHWKEIPPR
jgi:hypothetical protein